MLYFSLTTETAQVLQEHSASGWQPVSVAVLDSAQGFPDTTLLEAAYMQALDCQEGASPYNKSSSRALVTIDQIEGRSGCVRADPKLTRELFYRNRACLDGREPAEEYQEERPLEWQAKCLVIVIEEPSRKALLDALVMAGRTLTDPLQIQFNYTLSLSTNPDMAASSMNCAISGLIQENYARDAVGQQAQEELRQLQLQLDTKKQQIELFDRTVRGLSAYQPPKPPSLPPRPPRPEAPPGMLAPPIPPVAVDYATRLQQLRSEQTALTTAVEAKLAEVGAVCTPSATVTCGRTLQAAPNPWLAASGERCKGYETLEALEGLFCAHWTSLVRFYLSPGTLTLHTNITNQSNNTMSSVVLLGCMFPVLPSTTYTANTQECPMTAKVLTGVCLCTEQRCRGRQRRGRGASFGLAALVLWRIGRHASVFTRRSQIISKRSL